MNIKKSVTFYRDKNTGEVRGECAIYTSDEEAPVFNAPYLWKSHTLVCGTPEAQQFLLALADEWEDKHNKQFRLPIHLGGGVTVTYAECEFMLCCLHELMQMSDEEAAQQLTESLDETPLADNSMKSAQ